ncbi:YlmH/Sll1252 family protein [Guggenheimella bovis]
MKNNRYLIDHLLDLAEAGLDEPTFSNFLSLEEQQDFYENRSAFSFVEWSFHDERFDRKMIRFGSTSDFPIERLSFSVEEPLTHRDILGAYMHLGFERETIGNIFVDEKRGIFEVVSHMVPLVLHTMTNIKHSSVELQRTKEELPLPLFEKTECIVASERLDNVISEVFHISRQVATELIEQGKVLVVKRREKVSLKLVEGDIVSVRGFGKFRYLGILRETKKGNPVISIERYV